MINRHLVKGLEMGLNFTKDPAESAVERAKRQIFAKISAQVAPRNCLGDGIGQVLSSELDDVAEEVLKAEEQRALSSMAEELGIGPCPRSSIESDVWFMRIGMALSDQVAKEHPGLVKTTSPQPA